MHRILTTLKNLLMPAPAPQRSPEELRASFRKKYGNFRSLLTANNNALQAMADLEKIYYGVDSYRMAIIRSKISTIHVNVYKMIRNLQEMSGGKYPDLERIFERISEDLTRIVERKPEFREGPLVVKLGEVSQRDRDQVGEKMANLGEISAIDGVVVPQGFVVTASATRRFLTSRHLDEINRRLQVIDPEDISELYKTCAEIQNIVIDSPLPPDLEELLLVHYSRLEQATYPGCRVALRSSGLGEDTAGVSFAGLYRTILDVDKESILLAYKKVIASKYGARAIAYRRKRGYRHEDVEMCVGCLVMVDALVSGVIYSRDPGAETELISINAVSGIARGVVDGTTSTDLFHVDRKAPHPVLYSELRQNLHSGGSSLTEKQISELAGVALVLERHFGQPQDIEFSFDRTGTLYILQSRPMLGRELKKIDEARVERAFSGTGEPPFLVGGVCASGGVASGEVYLADSEDEMRAFPNGGILVLEHPTPEWAPLVSRASALIAETGTEAGHLATIAREFGIPALFSLPGALSSLVSGETITVNSSVGSVYHGRREDLLSIRVVRKDLMAGSPVQRILTEALQHITPLNLSDPASLQFKSSWCETLHDITRFCHEKSVSEMFTFGRNSHFDQGTAKRLVGEVPLEWWVINLADGFRKGVEDATKTVRIEDIVSAPMLAIWQGISAFPWQGPPPMSARGFGSIIFQSAIRPDLDPAVASTMATRNYFLISANFCNLSVRLGYHYAMIESYLSDLLTENYVTFRFKGGAADMQRKAVRAKLLAEVLQHFGFRVELRSDAVLARVKKQSAHYLRQRLQILGYLTLHARQLDMVMTQPQALERYKAKFLRDIDQMLSWNPTSTTGESSYADQQQNLDG